MRYWAGIVCMVTAWALAAGAGAYVVDRPVDLGGARLAIPQGEPLVFGPDGMLDNGVLVMYGTRIDAYPVHIFGSRLRLEGTVLNGTLPAEWWGARRDMDLSVPLQRAVDNTLDPSVPCTVTVGGGNWWLERPVTITRPWLTLKVAGRLKCAGGALVVNAHDVTLDVNALQGPGHDGDALTMAGSSDCSVALGTVTQFGRGINVKKPAAKDISTALERTTITFDYIDADTCMYSRGGMWDVRINGGRMTGTAGLDVHDSHRGLYSMIGFEGRKASPVKCPLDMKRCSHDRLTHLRMNESIDVTATWIYLTDCTGTRITTKGTFPPGRVAVSGGADNVIEAPWETVYNDYHSSFKRLVQPGAADAPVLTGNVAAVAVTDTCALSGTVDYTRIFNGADGCDVLGNFYTLTLSDARPMGFFQERLYPLAWTVPGSVGMTLRAMSLDKPLKFSFGSTRYDATPAGKVYRYARCPTDGAPILIELK